MNPCVDCAWDKLGCHESGLADHCPAWYRWKNDILLYQLQCYLDACTLYPDADPEEVYRTGSEELHRRYHPNDPP